MAKGIIGKITRETMIRTDIKTRTTENDRFIFLETKNSTVGDKTVEIM